MNHVVDFKAKNYMHRFFKNQPVKSDCVELFFITYLIQIFILCGMG